MKHRFWMVIFTILIAAGMLLGSARLLQATELDPGAQTETPEGDSPEQEPTDPEKDPEEGSTEELKPVVQQKTILAGQTSYIRKYERGKTITLNVTSNGNGDLNYLTSNRKVATVSSAGKVTLTGVGQCTITVNAEETEEYTAAKKSITITVWKRVIRTNYSSSYKSSRYYRRLKNLQLLDNTRENILKVAASQIGYHESNSRGNLRGSQKGKRNYNEYGRYYGNNGVPWCAIFVSWVARQNGISRSVVPKYCAVRSYYSYYRHRGRTHSWTSVRKRRYLPKEGDIILYSYSRGATTHHIGYVESAKYKFGKFYITTVEGNTKDAVRRVKMTLKKNNTSGKIGGQYITAFASPRY